MSLARRFLWPGLLAGAILRACVLTWPGTGDVDMWKIWSFGAAHDLTGVYGVGGTPPERRLLHWQGNETTVNYPPVAMAELGLAGRAYAWQRPLFEDSRALTAVVKLPGVLLEALLVALALTWGRRRFGADAAAATALLLWLNPASILTGPVLGYVDAQMTVPAVAALAAAWTGAGWLAGALAAAAVLTKPQALFVCPVIAAVLLWKRGSPRPAIDAAAASVAVLVLALVPYIARGAWPNFVQAMSRLATHDMLSANTSNVWWIVTWVLRVLDVAGEWGWHDAITQEVRILGISREIALGYPNARVVGTVLVLGAVAWAAWRTRRAASLAEASALAGWSAFAYAMLAAQVHENHLFLAIPFLAVAAGLDRRYRSMCGWITASFTLNLLLFYGLGRGKPWLVERSWTVIDASVLLAFVNMWLLTRTGRMLAGRAGLAPASDDAGVSLAR